MATQTETVINGTRGKVVVTIWGGPEPSFVVLLAHGYGEHAGRYAHVAEALTKAGAVVYAPDHLGHGRSEGERVSVENAQDFVTDLHAVADQARAEHPGLPVTLIGHSMGGLIATRYAQSYPDELTALVLSGPVIGGNPGFEMLMGMDPIPEIPIDPETLSRDPSVGEAYAADPLVWHGAFKREMLQAMFAAMDAVKTGPTLESIPLLWIHGEEDPLAPIDLQRAVVEQLRGPNSEEKVYAGARHEVFNETNQDEVIGDVTRFLTAAVAA
ncbi:MAG TPA: lysophospholipase [Solirubrobacteraceae bacterium]|jgi:alpha-beta hydrolase superfamily lysophospholipase|nr:lysophospholipase [Solirubrobacteraceae bacterium]